MVNLPLPLIELVVVKEEGKKEGNEYYHDYKESSVM
jgi:hypothetical protein